MSFGIHHHRQAGLPGSGNDGRQQGWDQDALAVVGEDDGIEAGKQGLEILPGFVEKPFRGRLPIFTVNAHNLLIAAYDPGLDGGLAATVDEQAAGIDAQPVKFGFKGGPGTILAHQTQDFYLGTQTDKIVDDIAGAAQNLGLALDIDHHDRGLGRNPLNLAPDVFVQHKIADHQHLEQGQVVQIKRG